MSRGGYQPWSESAPAWSLGAERRRLPDDRFDIEQHFVRSHSQHAENVVLCLAQAVSVGATGPVLAQAHFSRAARNDLIGQALAAVARDVLVALVGWTGEASLHQSNLITSAPRAHPALPAWTLSCRSFRRPGRLIWFPGHGQSLRSGAAHSDDRGHAANAAGRCPAPVEQLYQLAPGPPPAQP